MESYLATLSKEELVAVLTKTTRVPDPRLLTDEEIVETKRRLRDEEERRKILKVVEIIRNFVSIPGEIVIVDVSFKRDDDEWNYSDSVELILTVEEYGTLKTSKTSKTSYFDGYFLSGNIVNLNYENSTYRKGQMFRNQTPYEKFLFDVFALPKDAFKEIFRILGCF